MPPARTARGQLVSNENDENAGSTRMTRTKAKAAALNVDELALPTKQLQTKKGVAGKPAPTTRTTRNALGDVSNVTKVDAGRKAVGGKAGAVAKAAAPAGVQKSSARTAPTRSALSSKPANVTNGNAEKQSGRGTLSKRKAPAQAAANNIKEESTLEGEPARKQARVAATAAVDTKRAAPAKELKCVEPELKPTREFIRDPRLLAGEVPPGVIDLSMDDYDDPLMVAEYAEEIFSYMLNLELSSMPNPNYMDHQDDVEWKTRGILIDWLIEVHTRFHLVPETLFLAVNIVDRFLSEKVVQLDRLQLVGITAMFIASKYEEVMSPHVTNFRHVTDDGFSESEILSAERFILSTLNYDLSYPNPMNFLRRVSKADNYDTPCRTIGKYLMEISLLDHRFLQYRPSLVAASAMALSRIILDRGEWDKTISYYSGYNEDDVEPVVNLMVDYLSRPVIHEAFFKKYASKKFFKASILSRNWVEENGYLFGIDQTDVAIDQL
ncbi:G2/mitotic-specific cyclin-B [Pyricularia oryzae 70-15]|uniref:G2/mitotic-specific cyclin-B n=3 Tax=Pyricularia oryzae TaxID=318829 RepID=G4MNM0_PYRO7|nr:G2/mitotic-specific cyclin-B [Pyricularia oryzae 70-15]EHA57926.1 G2/mitotic-specific cyclin-B [Pyricularia oryzae 70-15]ELQ36942.1 G2/mitotic-specific cyclin-B [Pyricularia oryzae Y34]KAI7924410.1 G2/mitotic-specific cyclin-B [Pyricularia oryzae]KAI7931253.1 G2/mitotic-specific cyclin-B [Pyricularia oryzae]